MNIFRLAGDMTHLFSVLVLLLKIHTIKSCAGTSSLRFFILAGLRFLDKLDKPYMIRPKTTAVAELDFDGFGSFILDAISYICAGISLKTQELYAIVFTTRYLDLFTTYISLYNTIMKLIFLGSSISIVWYMRHHKMVRRSYDKDQDTFRHYLLMLPCLLLALLINEKFTFLEVMWAFSLYLEAVAILPQLVLLQRTRNIDNLTGQYVLLLG
ncbi:hypothetical protein Gotri_027101 [Gossypium trilobum]|uniref:ER lumen protein-retaining receptor n=1 Tax=Gossypium trilobum TaxID=34281 RepID=A0A7J9FQG4_9ROSI|nr:hypothetical protein [Gossypium trilobum]